MKNEFNIGDIVIGFNSIKKEIVSFEIKIIKTMPAPSLGKDKDVEVVFYTDYPDHGYFSESLISKTMKGLLEKFEESHQKTKHYIQNHKIKIVRKQQ